MLREHNSTFGWGSANILGMDEMRLYLSVESIRELTQGTEFVVEHEGLRIILSCDDAALVTFRTHIERAMLHMLPVGGSLPH